MFTFFCQSARMSHHAGRCGTAAQPKQNMVPHAHCASSLPPPPDVCAICTRGVSAHKREHIATHTSHDQSASLPRTPLEIATLCDVRIDAPFVETVNVSLPAVVNRLERTPKHRPLRPTETPQSRCRRQMCTSSSSRCQCPERAEFKPDSGEVFLQDTGPILLYLSPCL
jgi:hypothetical protein